jgi:hypothetical protein
MNGVEWILRFINKEQNRQEEKKNEIIREIEFDDKINYLILWKMGE